LQQLLGDTQQASQISWAQYIQKARKRQRDKKKSEQWLAVNLANRGVDVDEIGGLQKWLNSLSRDIQHTETHRHKVKDYGNIGTKLFLLGHKLSWQQQLAKPKKRASTAEPWVKPEQAALKALIGQLKEQQSGILNKV